MLMALNLGDPSSQSAEPTLTGVKDGNSSSSKKKKEKTVNPFTLLLQKGTWDVTDRIFGAGAHHAVDGKAYAVHAVGPEDSLCRSVATFLSWFSRRNIL